MSGYIVFIIRCITGKFKFLQLPPLKKACFLKRCGLFFEAGRIYYRQSYYLEAIECFETCQAYRNLMACYEKLGLVSEAVSIAHTHNLYKEGAKLCLRHNHLTKAAYFYHFFDLPQAIKLYKKLGHFNDLGLCYLYLNRPTAALNAFMQCENTEDKLKGLRLVEEAAIVLYFRKHYRQALKIFAGLKDYHSVLECAKKLKDSTLIEESTRMLSHEALQKGNLKEASKLIAPFDYRLARLYSYLHKLHNETLINALCQQDFFTILKYCFNTNNLILAKEVRNHWLHLESASSHNALPA